MKSIPLVSRRSLLCLALVGGAALLAGCLNQMLLAKNSIRYSETFLEKLQPLENGRLMPENWRLDNYRFDEQGNPTELRLDRGELGTIWLDLTGNGLDSDSMETSIEDYPLYALRFVDVRNDSSIWLRALPYPEYSESAKFNVLMRRLLDDFSIVGYSATCIGRRQCRYEKQRWAARIVSADDAVVSGYPAYVAVVEATDISKTVLSDETPLEYIEIVMIRTNLFWESEASDRVFPVLLIAAYSSYRDDFEEGRGVFRDFLERLQLDAPEQLPAETSEEVLLCAPKLDRIRFKAGMYRVYKTKRDSRQMEKSVGENEYQVRSPDLDSIGTACVKRAMLRGKLDKISGDFAVFRTGINKDIRTFVPKPPLFSNEAPRQQALPDSATTSDEAPRQQALPDSATTSNEAPQQKALPDSVTTSNEAPQQQVSPDPAPAPEEVVESSEAPPVSDGKNDGGCSPPCKENELCTKKGHCVPVIE